MKIGFLVVDMQKIFLDNGGIAKHQIDRAAEYINYVADLIRAGGHVVVHIRDIEDWTEATKEGFEIIPDIRVEEGDLHLTKVYSNAFWHTELEAMLKEREVGFVVVAGFAAEHCVLFTFNGARERGFKAAILQDGILSTKSDAITSAYRDRQIISYSAIDFIASSNEA